MEHSINILDIKLLYPNEWVLLGNPVMDDSKIDVLEGIPLFRSKDKKEVCYIGRKNLAAPISAKKGQILPSLRHFFRPMRCIELKKAACLTKICLLF